MSSKERQRESEVVVEAGGMISLGESQAVESCTVPNCTVDYQD